MDVLCIPYRTLLNDCMIFQSCILPGRGIKDGAIVFCFYFQLGVEVQLAPSQLDLYSSASALSCPSSPLPSRHFASTSSEAQEACLSSLVRLHILSKRNMGRILQNMAEQIWFGEPLALSMAVRKQQRRRVKKVAAISHFVRSL